MQTTPVQINNENTLEDVDPSTHNKRLADFLSLIGNYYVMAGDTYRAKVFNEASNKISKFPSAILSGGQAQKNIRGIGPSISEVIDEYLTTGTSRRLQNLENQFTEQRNIIDYFMSFYGIGPTIAVRLYNQGLRTLEDIWTKGNLSNAQKLGIMWREHINLRIPREEMDIINNTIASLLDPYGIKWSIAGSYRRREPSSGDVDLLVESRPDLNMDSLLELLKPIVAATLAQGPVVFRGIIRISDQYNGHRLDILLLAPENYPFSLMHFTGSQSFNILMRQRANEYGMTLSEYGLYDEKGRPQQAASEEDIFRILRVAYLPPEERTKTLDSLTYI